MQPLKYKLENIEQASFSVLSNNITIDTSRSIIQKKDNLVSIYLAFSVKNAAISSYTDLFSIPTNFRPKREINFIGLNTNNAEAIPMYINTSGYLKNRKQLSITGNDVFYYTYINYYLS